MCPSKKRRGTSTAAVTLWEKAQCEHFPILLKSATNYWTQETENS